MLKSLQKKAKGSVVRSPSRPFPMVQVTMKSWTFSSLKTRRAAISWCISLEDIGKNYLEKFLLILWLLFISMTFASLWSTTTELQKVSSADLILESYSLQKIIWTMICSWVTSKHSFIKAQSISL